MKKFYITTAIDYVNAKPHIGHAYEKILADALARWYKLRQVDVFFLTGTDENAQKNEQAAKEAKLPTKKFVDQNVKFFKELCKVLNINYSYFIRTTEKKHFITSQQIFQKVHDKGDIYKGFYEGYYCTGCEAFLTEKDLVDGKCPEHDIKPSLLKEQSYFFKLSKYEKQILKLVSSKDFIIPQDKRNEIIYRIKEEGLKDLSVSRINLDWGIPVPFDKKHKIYVWFDALINYISGIDYPSSSIYKKYWPADIHLIGKGINWFHSVIWPAILISAEIKLPKHIAVHGYLTIEGKKISKSLGNIIDPIELTKKYSSDSLRYSLIRRIPFGEDGDFSEKTLIDCHNNELANKLGNLVLRISTLIEKYGLEKTENNLLKKLKIKQIEKLFKNYELDKALNEIFTFIDICNEYIQNKKPWETKNKKVLYELIDSIKAISILLWPFIPETSEKLSKHFSFSLDFNEINKPLKIIKIKKPEILFKKIE